ncbi:hypothetical protein Rhopal_007453-T1 [Rhodotorula paludigena]|uniref:DNA damage-binding protein 1 n=1 Tax=Rhodotorula paludigena TaxID=86838 RepID=A0AAV5GV21_9BASI|nr:hypothetical protein Rhopal_007453-T1 [Rhodotorula paludigena]
MLYVAQTQGPTAQLAALACRFCSPKHDSLVVNKLTRLEISNVADDTLELVAEVPLWSSVAAIQSVHLEGQATASLVVLTTCLRLIVLAADASSSSPAVRTVSSISIAEPFGRLSEYQDILVDPTHKCVAVFAYSGLVRIVPLVDASASSSSSGRRGSRSAANASTATGDIDLSASYNVRLPTLNVHSLAFVPPSHTQRDAFPTLAAVYTDHTGSKILTTYRVLLDEKEFAAAEHWGPERVLADPGSELAIPVAGDDYPGLLVVGEESLSWHAAANTSAADSGKGKGKAVEGASAGTVSQDRFLLGDLYGKLLQVDVKRDSRSAVNALSVQDLGDTTSPTSIVPLSSSHIYLSSRFGDSQLVRLPSSVTSPDAMQDDAADASALQLVESYSSLAPILDCCVVGGEAGSSGYVVTCSGAFKTGSLRVVRRGVGLRELAALELEGVQRLWAIETSANEQLLVIGFFNETRTFRLSRTSPEEGGADDDLDLDIDEIDVPNFRTDAPTLFAGALQGGTLVQVTTQGVTISGGMTWTHESGKKVTAAAAQGEGRGNAIVLALAGGEVVVLEQQDGALAQTRATTFDNDVAALAVGSSSSGQAFAAVALWTTQVVHIVSLPSFEICASQTINSTFLIRSVLLTTFADGSTSLFAGLGDGTLVSYVVDLERGGAFAGSSEKTVALGRRPILLTEFGQGGDRGAFAASDRPTIVSKSRDRLVYSSVNLSDVTAVAPLSSSLFGSTLAVASSTSLTLGRIDTIQQVDVRTVPLDEDEPRRIVHDSQSKTFCVVCARRDVDRQSGEQSTTGVVRLVNEDDFETRATFTLDPNEEAQSVALVAADADTSFFVVGTAVLDPSANEPTEGRLLLIPSDVSDSALRPAGEAKVGGCPYAAVPLGEGFFATAVNSQVAVWSLGASGELAVVATWSGAFIALTLAVTADGHLAVGDALRSITLLRFHRAPQPKLEEVAKDYRSRYMVGVEALADGPPRQLIGAETDLNLFTVEHDPAAGVRNLADAGILAPAGAFHLGELVSRFRHGSLGQLLGDSSGAVQPKLVYTTSAGSIGVVAELDANASRVLSDLERNLRRVVSGTGGLSQEEYRAFKADKATTPSAGFVDGVFVEQFLDLSEDEQERVVQGASEHERLSLARHEVVRLLEEVARVH